MPGGPASGTAADCTVDGGMAQTVDPASCHPEAGPDPDAGGPEPAGDPMNGSEGDDDDCKYHIEWSSTPVCRDGNVTFTVTLTKKADGKPATGAHPYAEIVLPPSHTSPNTMPTSAEPQPGVYAIGPHKFDQPGKWYVRFHFYAECEDFPASSPHAHGAFFVNVP